MSIEVAFRTSRFRIATAMGAVAVAAVLLAPLGAGSYAETANLCLFGVECIFPCYLLLRLGRSRSDLEIPVSVMAVAFLCWGAAPFPPRKSRSGARSLEDGNPWRTFSPSPSLSVRV